METPKAARGQRDPEFLARMREKAAAKKAELKAIRDAEELQKKQAHEAKLAQARKVLQQASEPAAAAELPPKGAAIAARREPEPEPVPEPAAAVPEKPKPQRKAKQPPAAELPPKGAATAARRAPPPPEPETEESESEEETEEEAEEPPPPPRKSKAKPRASLAARGRASAPVSAQPAQPAFSWKEAYYHAKLERMMQPPHPQPQPQPPSIHQAVRHDIVQRVNKRMMDDLMKEYFPHG